MPSPSQNQPWKSEWPPSNVASKGTSHGCPAGTLLYGSGDTVSKPRDKEPIQTPEPTNKHEALPSTTDGETPSG
ncbi:hypothetical protein AK830_g2375 [Neonectria ditissima]|uniref:Uncharacterized protein n=1 Tax=Neonectria ditissima TaxID=78410 RepID=A0A0P7BFH1_9HYPO|nr:hypothetical protein AK830_g2375 [Neonectria ditissima]